MKIENKQNPVRSGRQPLPPVVAKTKPSPRFNGARAQRLFRAPAAPNPFFALRRVWTLARPALAALRSLQSVLHGGLRAS